MTGEFSTLEAALTFWGRNRTSARRPYWNGHTRFWVVTTY